MRITLPHNWQPRDYQRNVLKFFMNGGRYAVCCWHRRAGKDECAMHLTAWSAHARTGSYWHLLPKYNQARRAIWSAVDPHSGRRRIDRAFPKELRAKTDESEMSITFRNGSTWQLVGADNYDRLVGSSPAGIVLSEYATMSPAVMAFISPIVRECKGWVLAISTPRGFNHFWKLFDEAQKNPEWFCEHLPATKTGVFSEADLKAEEAHYISQYGSEEGEAFYRQEYLCSFEAAVLGSFFGNILSRAEEEGRITNVPVDPTLPVFTAWDLGIDDSTAIWFVQVAGREVRVIDYYEISGQALTDTAKVLLNEKTYTYADHYLPHDVEVREMTSGLSRKDTLERIGLRPIRPGAKVAVEEGINAARNLLRQCVFDRERCDKGLNALRLYRKQYDEKSQTFHRRPLHDWTSHAADAFRELAVNLNPTPHGPRPTKAIMEYDEFDHTAPAYHRGRQTNYIEDYNPMRPDDTYDPFGW